MNDWNIDRGDKIVWDGEAVTDETVRRHFFKSVMHAVLCGATILQLIGRIAVRYTSVLVGMGTPMF